MIPVVKLLHCIITNLPRKQHNSIHYNTWKTIQRTFPNTNPFCYGGNIFELNMLNYPITEANFPKMSEFVLKSPWSIHLKFLFLQNYFIICYYGGKKTKGTSRLTHQIKIHNQGRIEARRKKSLPASTCAHYLDQKWEMQHSRGKLKYFTIMDSHLTRSWELISNRLKGWYKRNEHPPYIQFEPILKLLLCI